ncbi:L,D-transpeptidase family protein [Litoreibacter roseus]|uniref:L,D-TPase catalytic domain-containing protein n=1 Tax=Litoreibacter roseus TaxID=2601869 RepID=A0A6N6JGQ3_9RHOB|nr:L,D-transpeptidase family protein [Litoreibacter roseus]GFE64468.1 hypothetical protein KIN_15420 [Litoreibacter roseus]
MTGFLTRLLFLCSIFFLVGCGDPKFITYDGPEVTRVAVYKEARVMLLYSGDEIIKGHRIDLGFGPRGHKQFEGDGRTPEGRYEIDRRNPESSFYLSLGISYPNAEDIAFARAAGKEPGGDIFIHGQANRFGKRGPDWTAGCIAVTNDEMRQIYAMVKDGTVVDIYP